MVKQHMYLLALVSALMLSAAWSNEAHAETSTPLSATDIQRTMARHSASIQRCYVRHAMAQKGATGSVTLEMRVRMSGNVDRLKVEAPSVRGRKFEQCVRALMPKWKFPRSSSNTTVKYPFLFVHTYARGAGPVYRRTRTAKRN